jgi:dihydroorotate dehydrogenase electron transfer subunit
MNHQAKSHRETIFLEEAEILSHQAFPSQQYLIRLRAPECALQARPGSFVHLQCAPSRPLRRPISIMRSDAAAGWIDLLYKAVGQGTRQLAARKPGEQISTLGPIGRPFTFDPQRRLPLLIGGGVGMPPMVFIAQVLAGNADYKPFAILGSEVPFPFAPASSGLDLPGIPPQAVNGMPLLESWGVPSRLASLQGYDGCFQGYVTDLARHWLDSLDTAALQQVAVYACGPHPMLEAVARMAAAYNLPCQVSLEEFMACGVGGCAGCVVPVRTARGSVMKRVCVDGPVFDATEIFA